MIGCCFKPHFRTWCFGLSPLAFRILGPLTYLRTKNISKAFSHRLDRSKQPQNHFLQIIGPTKSSYWAYMATNQPTNQPQGFGRWVVARTRRSSGIGLGMRQLGPQSRQRSAQQNAVLLGEGSVERAARNRKLSR